MNSIRQPNLILLAFSLAALTACSREPKTGTGTASEQIPAAAIQSVMAAQQNAWNRGDIESFMAGYDQAETTTFVSGDELTRGWQTVLERYKQRYKSKEDMGTLSFTDLDVKALGPDLAIVDGRWKLTRAGDAPHGRFTLFFRRIGDNWRIVHDTTTSAAP
jgi:beta-aspartyl-peptidase (threonine type)